MLLNRLLTPPKSSPKERAWTSLVLNPLLWRVIAQEKAWLGKSGSLSTHPDIATLIDPLFSFAGKRVNAFFSLFFCPLSIFPYPLSAAGEERVVQRSADRVSKLYACNFRNMPFLGYYSLGEGRVRLNVIK